MKSITATWGVCEHHNNFPCCAHKISVLKTSRGMPTFLIESDRLRSSAKCPDNLAESFPADRHIFKGVDSWMTSSLEICFPCALNLSFALAVPKALRIIRYRVPFTVPRIEAISEINLSVYNDVESDTNSFSLPIESINSSLVSRDSSRRWFYVETRSLIKEHPRHQSRHFSWHRPFADVREKKRA